MTEQEAEAWATRLTRIWVPPTVFGTGVVEDLATFDNDCLFYAHVQPHVSIEVLKTGEVFLCFYRHNGYTGSLYAHPCGEIREADHFGELGAVPAQWLPFFRRGCWLSGIPIEASAHEKVEWIRGFTREELQAWNLKM
jgi:hypothetical protein